MQSSQPGDGGGAVQQAAVIHCSSFCLGAAPTWREASSPFLNSIRVGIDMMPYFCAVFGLSSTLSFTILTLAPSVPAISSSAGPIMRQGPHHSAQKSTTTGPVALSTSISKSTSLTLPTPMGDLVVFGERANPARGRRTEPMEPCPERQGALTGR